MDRLSSVRGRASDVRPRSRPARPTHCRTCSRSASPHSDSPRYGITSAMGPGVLWRDYMTTVVGMLPPDWYPRPPGVVDVTVCVNPGLYGGNGLGQLPGPYCPSGFRRVEHFVD